MTEPKRFKRGRRTYTRVGAHREVRIDAPAADPTPPASAPFEAGPGAEMPVYANAAAVHRSPDEIILDLAFSAPGRPRARVSTRVAMSPQLAGRLSALLARASENE